MINARQHLRAPFLASALALAVIATPALAEVTDAFATRAAPDQVHLTWKAKGPVDVLLAADATGSLASARTVASADRDGDATVAVDATARPYFLLRDRADGKVTRLAERVVPLAQGSNFRDVGGYQTTDGRHVRWGVIYRSGASAMLNGPDLARVHALGLNNLVDLRSDEERVLAPTKIDGVPYSAVGYSMAALIPTGTKSADIKNGTALYHGFPKMLAPQLRIVFGILERGDGPIEYNCSAGQDRTGFVTAMVLSALGVPRETILKDYVLSTKYRQPRWEMPHIDVAAHPGDPAAAMFAHYQDDPRMAVAQPLVEADGTPFLTGALDEIDSKWGSVDAYLEKEVGVTPAIRAKLRATYLD